MTDDIQASPPTAARASLSGTGLESFAAGPQPAQSAITGEISRALDPAEILRILNRWKWVILGSALVGLLLALGLSLLRTPLYVATVQLQINQEDPQIIKGADSARPVMINSTEFLNTQIGLLRSRDLAARVVDAQRLTNNPDYAAQSRSAAERRDSAIDLLLGQMTVEEVRNSRLVNISITSPNASLAAQLANSYADQFIASDLDRDFKTTSYARKFLEDRIASTRAKLEDTERQLVGYAASQGIIELGSDEKGAGRQSLEASMLVTLNTALAQARTDRIMAAQRSQQARGGRATTEANASPVLQELLRRRAEAQAEYDAKLTTYLPALPAMIALHQRIESIDQDIGRERGRFSSGANLDYQAAVAREHELQDRVDGLRSKMLDLRSRSIQYTILQRDVDTNRALYEALLQKYKEVGVAGGIGTNKVAVVDSARPPKGQISPRVFNNVLLGLLVGLFLGLVGAFLFEFIDDTIKSPEDVRTKLHMTLLGVMPTTPAGSAFMESVVDPKSELIEAAHSLRTSLQFATGHGMPKSLLISSSRPGEGKSSVVLALAISLARLGKKVLIIDADLRKPSFYVGGASRQDTLGLSNVLNGESQLSEVVRPSKFDNFFVLPAGPAVPNPASLLSEGGFAKLLDSALKQYDHVIVDGPPVIGLADSPLMGAVVEGAVMIVEAASVHRSTILASVLRLVGSKTRVLGVVLNKFESRKQGYGYGYSYDYGADASDDSEHDDRKILVAK